MPMLVHNVRTQLIRLDVCACSELRSFLVYAKALAAGAVVCATRAHAPICWTGNVADSVTVGHPHSMCATHNSRVRALAFSRTDTDVRAFECPSIRSNGDPSACSGV